MLTLPWVPPKRRNDVSSFNGTVELPTSRAGDALACCLTGSRPPGPPARSPAPAHSWFPSRRFRGWKSLSASREPLAVGSALSLGHRLVNCTRIGSLLRSKAEPVHTPCFYPDTRPASLSVASSWRASCALPTESLASASPGWGPREPAALLMLMPMLEPPVHALLDRKSVV